MIRSQHLLLVLVIGLGLLSARVEAHPELDAQLLVLNEYITSNPASAELYWRRAEIFRQHDQWNEALRDLDTATTLGPALNAVDLTRGQVFLGAGRLSEARASLERYLQKAPDAPEGWMTRGRVRLRDQDALGAAEDFNKAVQLLKEPRPEHYQEWSAAFLAAGDAYTTKALDVLNNGLARMGSIISLELSAVTLEKRLGLYDSALHRVDRLLQAAPRKEIWLERKAEVLLMAGKPGEARDCYLQAIHSIANLPPFHQQTTHTRALLSRLEQHLEKLP